MSTKHSFSLLVWILRYRLKNGKAPLSIRITVNGERAEVLANREITLSLWDPKSKSAIQGNWSLFSSVGNAYTVLNYYLSHVHLPLSHADELVDFTDEILENIRYAIVRYYRSKSYLLISYAPAALKSLRHLI
jgi:hypothetical protein